jgi:hypothetical protein
MPLTLPFRVVFAASAATLACSVSLITLLKSVLRAECPAPGGSNLRPVAIVCVVATALCLVASAAYLVKSRAWTQAAAICSKWQPVFFAIVTVEAMVLRAIVSAVSRQAGSCSEYENAVHAVSLMWNCAVLMAAFSTMCCDTAADLSPRLRRCAYGLLALVLLLDAIGSVIWGNPLASDASFSLTANFSIFLDSQLTSCIASQVVIALHFAYVSCRSRRGRGWAYASLRFELDECGKSMSMAVVPTMESGAAASAATTMLALDASAPAELQHAGAARWKGLSRLRQRWLQFQQRQVSRCRVFVIPCVAMRDAGGGGNSVIALARPAFDLRLLRPLQRLVDAHPRYYAGFGFFCLVVPCIACNIYICLRGQAARIFFLVLNFCLCIMVFVLLSSKRYGLDRVAAKHVTLSFRFAIIVTLLATDTALYIRAQYTFGAVSLIIYLCSIICRNILFLLCILLECSPHLPPSVQIYISVRARVQMQC